MATAAGVVAVIAPGVLLAVDVVALAGVLVVLVVLAPAGGFAVLVEPAFTAPLGLVLVAVVEVIGQGLVGVLPLPGRVVVDA